MKSPKDSNVCIIGAGVCGIVALKTHLECGFKVTCFERSWDYGGLWCYREEKHDPNGEFNASIMKTTILNTSKELSSFSDFPPPAHLPNFMKHQLYMDYIRSYVKHFNLLSHIKVRHEILHCEPQYDLTKNEVTWLIEIKNLIDNVTSKLKFDKLLVAIGHHNIPYIPTFQDQHKFKGQIIHTGKLKDILHDDRFIDKNVVVVGFGNSACDAATDLAIVTNKCYVSTHRGNWFYHRLAPSGLFDFEEKTRFVYLKNKYLPQKMQDKRTIKKLESRTNHQFLGLTPKHKPSEAVPAINDLFPYRVFTGGITLKDSLKQFTENGVIFEGEENCEYKIDVVVLATGYTTRATFLNEFELGLKSQEHDEYDLYLNIFAPKLTITGLNCNSTILSSSSLEATKSLAFIGFVQPAGSILVISELQSRFVAQVFSGKCELPSVEEMIKQVEKVNSKVRSRAIRSHSRDQVIGCWIGYQEKIASMFGVKPNLSALFFKDFTLWKQLMFGPAVPYQYRLNGPGNWDKARETILSVNERVCLGVNEGKNHILFKVRRKRLTDKNADGIGGENKK